MNEIDLDKIDMMGSPPEHEPERQYYFMAKCREWVREFEQKNGRYPLACIQTFGCQMNAKDSEKLSGILTTIGYGEGRFCALQHLYRAGKCEYARIRAHRVSGQDKAQRKPGNENCTLRLYDAGGTCGCKNTA